MKNNLIIIVIVVLGTFLRFWQLANYPISLNWDEISHGYNAYSLLQTGHDQWGNLPVFNFRAYGDYPTTLNLYLTIPFIKFFGLNDFTTRLPTALLGSLTILFVYLLSQALFKSSLISFITCFLYAFSPWTFFTSRAVFQSTVAQFFLISGIYFLITTPKPFFYRLIGSLLLGLSLYGYHNARIVAPLIFILINIIFPTSSRIKRFMVLAVFLLLALPNLLNLFTPESRARNQWVGLFNSSTINYLESQYNLTPNKIIAKLKYNKVSYALTAITNNYLSFINPLPLFFTGTGQYQFNLPHTGILFPICLPFFYLGLIVVLQKIKQPKNLFLVLWFVLGLIPAAITQGDFPILRAMTILPVPFFFIAFGLDTTIKLFRHSLIIFLVIFIFQLCSYLTNYFFQYPQSYASSWQYGYRQVITYLKENYPQYQSIWLTKKYGEPHEYLLYYWPWDSNRLLADPQFKWDYHANWYWVDSFDKFQFINDWEIKDKLKSALPGTLAITSPGNYPSNFQLLKTIYYPDGTPVFAIVSLRP